MQTSNVERHIVGICGSLRKQSNNRGLLRAFAEQLPPHVRFTLADISEIPFYNEDIENPYPEAVVKLKNIINSADAFVISSPEYNLSYTGVLKNTLEWLSRRSLEAQLAGKPVALIGTAAIGVGVSQSHLRDVMFALNLKVLTRPIVHVGNSREKFDQEGNLIDPNTRNQLVMLKDALLDAMNK